MLTVQHSYQRSHDAQGSSGGVYPRFFTEEVQDPLASAQAGRPIFKLEERVEIVIPGDMTKCPVYRVTDVHKERWPEVYAQFQKGMEQILDGTPLTEWPILNRAQISELSYFGFRRVEDLRDASDTVLQKFPGGFGLREKAKAYLDDAEAMALTERLTKENDTLRMEVDGLRRQMLEQGELLRQIHAETMARRNAPDPMETMPMSAIDPMAGLSAPPQQPAPSSLAEFDAPPRRRGRPPRAAEVTAAE